MAFVPVSPIALSWAIKESGFSPIDLDRKLRVAEGTVNRWIDGNVQPNRTQFKQLKSVLKRPGSLFFMNTPPLPSATKESTVKMRYAFGAKTRSRSPEERVAIRDASRIQRFVSELSRDLGLVSKEMPSASTNENPEDVANAIREEYITVPIERQMSWSSPANAFRQWRTVIENLDILVFLYPLGEHSARGFSFANDRPPLIGINTSWHASVRIYSLFHELGHVLTRTNSLCIEATGSDPTADPIERWCEMFAASFLMPRAKVEELKEQSPYSDAIRTATWLSNKLHVSRKAALLRLVDLKSAHWRDFRELEARYERKNTGGSPNPEETRTRDVVRKHTYGKCLSTVCDAHQANLVSEADIRTYLRVYPEELK